MSVFHSRASVSFSPRQLGKFYHLSSNVFSTDIKNVLCLQIFLFRLFAIFFLTLCKSSVTFSVVPRALELWRFWASTAKTEQSSLVYGETVNFFPVSCLF